MADNSVRAPKPVAVCLLGGLNSGKTCFIGGLALLADPNATDEVCVTGLDSTTVSYLEELGTTLRKQQWPPATSRMLKPLKLRLSLGQNLIELWTLDYGGENFENDIKRLSPDTLEELREHLHSAETLLLLFDPRLDLGVTHDGVSEPPVDEELSIQRQTAHLQAIDWIWSTRREKPGAPEKLDIAIIVTKCDAEPNLQTPAAAREFFQRRAPGLDAKLRERADQVSYFPLSAVGATEVSPETGHAVPAARPRPFGYTNIVRWIIGRRRAERRGAFVRYAVAGVFLAAVAAVGVWGYQSVQCTAAETILASRDLSAAVRLDRTQNCPCETVQIGRNRLAAERIIELQRTLEASLSPRTLDSDVLPELRALRVAAPASKLPEIEQLLLAVETKRVELRFREVQTAFDSNSADLPNVVQEFVREFSGSPRAGEARELLHKWRDKKFRQALAEVRAQGIQGAEGLAAKGRLLTRLINEYEPQLKEEKKPIAPMRRAAELASWFSAPRDYLVTLKESSGFVKSRHQGVKLFVNDELMRSYESPGSAREVHWDREPITIRWQTGVPIRIELWNYSWLNGMAAWVNLRPAVALLGLGRMTLLSRVESAWASHVHSPQVNFEIEGISADDLNVYERFIDPGDEL